MAAPPLLIAPLIRRPLPAPLADRFAKDYALGWLVQTENGFGWVVWGSSATIEGALRCRAEILAKSGPREVLISHEPLPKDLTVDQVAQIRTAQTVH